MADEVKGDGEEKGRGQQQRQSAPDAAPGDGNQSAGVTGAHGAKTGGIEDERIERAVGRSLRWPETIMAAFTVVIACAAIAQWHEMSASGIDTHALASDTQNLASAAAQQANEMSSVASAGEAEASAAALEAQAMENLRAAGQAQALAAKIQAASMDKLRAAGEAQAAATRNLAENSARQLSAIQASADAARAQASAVGRQADATVTASRATDRLATAGQAQSAAVLQSLDVAREANDIASRASLAADRPWVTVSLPPGDIEPVAAQDYKVSVTLTNVGRSPALKTTTRIEFTIFNKNSPPDLQMDPCGPACQIYTIFPTGGGFQGTGISYNPTILAALLTPAEVAKIASFDDIILLRFRVDYLDSGGRAHETITCNYFAPKLGFTSCTAGNDAN